MWILVLGASCVLFFGFACYVHIAGPEPVGWRLQAEPDRAFTILSVEPESPAARAGLRPGDVLLERDLRRFSYHEQADRRYQFEVSRGTVTITLHRAAPKPWALALLIIPAINLLLAGVIVFARPNDLIGRWGALVLAAMGAFNLWYGLGRPFGIEAAIRSLPLAASAFLLIAPVLASVGPAVLVTFLAGFPRSAIGSRGLWLLFCATTLPGAAVPVHGVWAPVYSPDLMYGVPAWFAPTMLILVVVYCIGGAVLLARNYARLKDPNERRRVRVVVSGFLVTLAALAVEFGVAAGSRSLAPFDRFAINSPAHWLFIPFHMAAPACMAYAILRHRIFDIRVMIRQGVQYAAARDLLLAAVPVLALVLVADLLLHGDRPLMDILVRRGGLYAGLAATALLLHSRRNTWLTALDRRFYRERYDARRVLREVVEEVRASNDFAHAASRVVSQIEATLHPETVAVLGRQPHEDVYRVLACAPTPPPAIPAQSKIVGLIRLLGKPVEIPQSDSGWVRQQLPPEESRFLRDSRLEWLFPISLQAAGAEAILALGPKRSEEPYSGEDQDLILAIAASLALVLERSPAPPPAPAASSGAFKECPQCGACYDAGASLCTADGAMLAPLSFPRSLAQRYRFERRIGRGGMGTVYEALDSELERRVAIKLIRPDRVGSPAAAARFKREAQAAAGLSHPNVVTVFDFGAGADSGAYLVMELLLGRTLRAELQEHGRIAPQRAAKIMTAVCAAVAAAHARHLLHRDLKPENIFLGEGQVAKVLDFGLAKPLTPPEGTDTVLETSPGLMVGTMPYMSPEQLRGGAPGESWDLWALAVTAYETLTSAYPFAPDGHILPCRLNAPEAPESWDAFFRRALATEISLRPSSAESFAAEFRSILG